MALKPFRLLGVSDAVLSRIQDAVAQAFAPLTRNLLLDSNFVTDVTLTSGADNLISHGLGRAYEGFIVTKCTADTRVWISSSANTSPDKYINLRPNVTGVVTLYVF